MALGIEILSWLCLGTGSLVLVGTAAVIVRMRSLFMRAHVASVNETLGPALILLGLALQADGNWEVIVKLALILFFLVLTGPVSSHALAKAALDNGILPDQGRRESESQPVSEPPGGEKSPSQK